jgi:hypothetical protein
MKAESWGCRRVREPKGMGCRRVVTRLLPGQMPFLAVLGPPETLRTVTRFAWS